MNGLVEDVELWNSLTSLTCRETSQNQMSSNILLQQEIISNLSSQMLLLK